MNTRDVLAIGTESKPPVLYRGEYQQWRDRFLDFIESKDRYLDIKASLEERPTKFTMTVPAQVTGQPERTVPKTLEKMDENEKNRVRGDQLAKTYILLSLPDDIYMSIDSYKDTAKGMWDQIAKMMMGSKAGNQLNVTNCITRYDAFKAKQGETITETYDRFCLLLNDLNKNRIEKTPTENNIKLLNNLQPEWKKYASHIRHNHILETLPLHELYEMLLQDEEEILEMMEEKKQTEKPAADLLALVADKRERHTNRSSRKEGESQKEEEDGNESDPELQDIKKVVALLTRAVQKKFYKKPSSNSQRYSTNTKRHDYKDMYENKKRSDDRKQYDTKPEEKEIDEPIKCYNCRNTGHFSRDCRKPVVRNSEYYKNKMLLAKQKEADKALMAEDDHWLNLSDEDKEEDDDAHMYLMDSHSKEDNSDNDDRDSSHSESACQVCQPTHDALVNQMQIMMRKLEDYKDCLKEKTNQVSKLETMVEKQHKVIDNICLENADNLFLVNNYKKKKDVIFEESESLKTKLSELSDKLKKLENERTEYVNNSNSVLSENRDLIEKLKDIELKFYKRGQTDQTIHLNKPKEFKYFNAEWGIGYDNPHYLNKILSKVPTLYEFDFLGLDKTYPEYKIRWTKSSDEVEEQEDLKRQNKVNMQLPFVFE